MNRIVVPGLILFASLIGLGIGAFVSAPAVKAYITYNRVSACWSPAMKKAASQLIQSQARTIFMSTLPSDFSSKDRQRIKKSFKAPVSGFYADQAAENTTKIKCGTGLGYTYKRPDGSISTHDPDRIVYFDIYPARGGYTPVMSLSQIPDHYVVYRENVILRKLGLRLVTGSNGSVIVSSVGAGLPADQAGVEPEDILLGVGHSDVSGLADAEQLIEKAHHAGKSAVALRIKRNSNVLFIPVSFNR